jgi:hypothetical protein
LANVSLLIDLVRPDVLRPLMREYALPNEPKTGAAGRLSARYWDKTGLTIFYDETDPRLADLPEDERTPSPIEYLGPVDPSMPSTARQLLRLAYQSQETQGLPSRILLPSKPGVYNKITLL